MMIPVLVSRYVGDCSRQFYFRWVDDCSSGSYCFYVNVVRVIPECFVCELRDVNMIPRSVEIKNVVLGINVVVFGKSRTLLPLVHHC